MAEYVEIESGKRSVDHCKLDRLASNLHFVSGLMESGVDFVAADNPHASRLVIHMMVAFAEHEMISKRTKDALAARKVRGHKLGNPRWQESISNAGALSRRTAYSSQSRQDDPRSARRGLHPSLTSPALLSFHSWRSPPSMASFNGSMGMEAAARRDHYQEVTDRIVEALEQEIKEAVLGAPEPRPLCRLRLT